MAHKRKTKQLRMTFEDGPLGPNPDDPTDEPLVVTMRGVPISTIFDLGAFAGIENQFSKEGIEAMSQVFSILADALIEWNLTEDVCKAHELAECDECPPDAVFERPVPPTLEGVKTLDLAEAQLLIQTWTERAAGVSGPLEQPSAAGAQSAAMDHLPMEVSPGS
jgi:hypothetical protein